MKKIILDTCFILTAIKYKIDIKSEISKILNQTFSLYIIDKTLNELENKKLQKLSLEILKTLNCSEIHTKHSKKNVDSLIIDHCKNYPQTIVATQDKALKEKLKKRNTRLITIRQKKYLRLINS